jgi:hypothetical protein
MRLPSLALAAIAIAASAAAATAAAAPAQSAPAVTERRALVGSWSLNRERSGVTPSPDFTSRRGGRRGGAPGGFGGGFGGNRGGATPTADGRAAARAEADRVAAVVQELITPTPRWDISIDRGETLAFTSDDGRTARYTPDNKNEKHQLINGTVQTKSRWVRSEFRQEIAASETAIMTRTFAVDPATDQLVVSMTFGRQADRDRPFRLVYDRDED